VWGLFQVASSIEKKGGERRRRRKRVKPGLWGEKERGGTDKRRVSLCRNEGFYVVEKRGGGKLGEEKTVQSSGGFCNRRGRKGG